MGKVGFACSASSAAKVPPGDRECPRGARAEVSGLLFDTSSLAIQNLCKLANGERIHV
jgi:hypothetical protein